MAKRGVTASQITSERKLRRILDARLSGTSFRKIEREFGLRRSEGNTAVRAVKKARKVLSASDAPGLTRKPSARNPTVVKQQVTSKEMKAFHLFGFRLDRRPKGPGEGWLEIIESELDMEDCDKVIKKVVEAADYRDRPQYEGHRWLLGMAGDTRRYFLRITQSRLMSFPDAAKLIFGDAISRKGRYRMVQMLKEHLRIGECRCNFEKLDGWKKEGRRIRIPLIYAAKPDARQREWMAYCRERFLAAQEGQEDLRQVHLELRNKRDKYGLDRYEPTPEERRSF